MSAPAPEPTRDDACVLLLDPDGWIEMVGHGSERLTGWTRRQLARKNFEILGAHVGETPARAALQRAMKAGQDWLADGFVTAPNGARIECRMSVQPLQDDHDQHRHFVCTIRPPQSDRARDAELARARAQAAAAARTRDEFVRNMGHELRTPMNGILGLTDGLLAGELRADQRADLETLRRSAGELLSVIGELLTAGGLEGGASVVERTPFRLRALLHELDARLGPEAAERGLRWSCEVDERLPEALVGDAGRLRHALGRLADHGVRHTEHGSVRLRARLEAVSGAEVRVAFEVADSGVGMSEDQLRVLHDPFAAAGAAPASGYGGPGLGLVLAARQVHALGGRLAVASRVGEGTTFSFELGFARHADDPAASVVPVGARVMFVGGGPGTPSDTRLRLARWTPSLIVAPTVNEATDLLLFADDGPGTIAAVVLDARGAAFDPFEVADMLAGAGARPVPLLLVIDGAQRADAEAWREQGLGIYLVEPVSEAALREGLAQLLRGALPAPARAAGLPMSAVFPTVAPDSAVPAARSLEVLVVDDHSVNRAVAMRLLERSGYTVEVADGGRHALERLAAKTYDLVLMDLAMPEIDGLEVTRRLRALEAREGRPRTPVIAVTAHAFEADRAAVLAAGMDAFVTKPIDPDVLFLAMSSLAGRVPRAPEREVVPALGDVVDWREGLACNGDDADALRDALRLFLEEAPQLAHRLDEARASGEGPRIERAARALRGAATLAFAPRLVLLAGDAERFAGGGHTTEAATALEAVRGELRRVTAALAASPEIAGRAA